METIDRISVGPDVAWDPLPAKEWDADAARHLLRRTGWTALPADADAALGLGLPATLDRLFPPIPPLFPEPESVADYARRLPDSLYAARTAGPEERRQIQRESRERAQAALQDMSIRWLRYASAPGNAAFAKWVLFLSDIYVVASEKVQQPNLIWRHNDILARGGLGPTPFLAKAVALSPAMIIYLDLNQNRLGAPNENFARELFELFLLGEGNYTERDIKEAARAFTGYRYDAQADEVIFAERQHDYGRKTVFGSTGRFDGAQVIDLAYRLPAAGAFFPHELVKFYLSDTMLPADYLHALGDRWRTEGGYDLRWLALRFFGSRIFFAPEFRGNFIKSPLQYYLGMVQDLGLEVTPIPRLVLYPLRQTGQILYNPPNVRGWTGGRTWINSGSLSARRTLVEQLFANLDENRLNADERRDLEAARAAGTGKFVVDDAVLEPFAALSPDRAVARLQEILLPSPAEPGFAAALEHFVGRAEPGTPERLRRIRRATASLLESPAYHLC